MKLKSELVNHKNGKKNILLLSCSSFFNDVGSELITPILPFYITALGGGGLAVGLISGLREGLSSLLKILGGWFSDRIGKRIPIVAVGYFISALLKFLMGFAGSFQQLIALVSFERAGKMRDAPRDVIISLSTEKKGRGFGFHQMMDSAGGILGVIIVLLLFWKLNIGFKTLIFIAAGISTLSLIPLLFVKDSKTQPIKKSIFQGISEFDKRLKYVIFVTSFFALANFGIYMFFLLKAKAIAGNIVIPLLFYGIYSLIHSSFSISAGSLSDKLGRKKVLAFGYLLMILVAIGFAFFNSLSMILVLFALYGLVMAITEPTQKAFIIDFAGEAKGTALGAYHSVRGIMIIIAGIIAGLLWNLSPQIMFIYVSAVAFLSLILLRFAEEKR